MSWMEKLCETYDIFAGEVGVMPLDGKTPLQMCIRDRTQTAPHNQTNTAISIHAPAWGATSREYLPMQPLPIFQSTLPRGERLS